MYDLGERLAKVAVTPTGSAIAKRQKVAIELKGVSDLVEEMLSIAKQILLCVARGVPNESTCV